MITAVTETADKVAKIVAAAKPAPCSTGSWVQKFSCGYHQPASANVGHAGFATGSALMPALITAFVIWMIIASVRSVRRGTATSS
jgi:hypothetical protein